LALTFQCAGTSTVVDVQIDILSMPQCPNLDLVRARVQDALLAGATHGCTTLPDR